ncbi:MAG: DUF1467 family protein [Parvibaculum sp.]|uniref:DUF1467 family protein n=1 Tax=Parvibaculum sp. TaxID=2024848 RepID=UPI00271F6BF8|nr:DUF1467 family protein [Parvibaculum sp.]MDO8840557.1 DUF1467 family protein [Parvibaculum sp.]
MTWTAGLAIYFVVWWIVLFAILPWGVRAQTTSEVPAGGDPGAPAAPLLLWKMGVTTIVAALVWALIVWLVVAQPVAIDDLPFMPDFGDGY